MMSFFYHYIELDPMGPMIDGDMVMQGSSIHESYAPAFAVVEHCGESGEYAEVDMVQPWTMMLSPPEGDDGVEGAVVHKAARFIIPISVEKQYRTAGRLRLRLYVDDVNKIPYDEEDTSYDMSMERRAALPLAILMDVIAPETSSAGTEEVGEEAPPVVDPPIDPQDAAEEAAAEAAAEAERVEEEQHQLQKEEEEEKPAADIIKDIKIAADYDDVAALQAEGYELVCTHITPDGVQSEQGFMWPFHILASYIGPHDSTGLEDIQWVKCLKSLGTLPEVPLFEIMHDYDLSSADDDVSTHERLQCYSAFELTRKAIFTNFLNTCLSLY